MAAFDISNIKPQVTADLSTGDIVAALGPVASAIPASGRLVCDGSVISNTDYPALFGKVSPLLNLESPVFDVVEFLDLPTLPTGVTNPFAVTEKHLISSYANSFHVSEDDGVTWTTFPSSGNHIWHFDAGSHLLIMVNGNKFHLIDKADIYEPTQWLTPLFTQTIQSNNGRYLIFDHWQGYFYGIVSTPVTGQANLVRISLRSILARDPEIELKSTSITGGYNVSYSRIDVANGRVLLHATNTNVDGNAVEINWSDGSLRGVFRAQAANCTFQIPAPGSPSARWAIMGGAWIYQGDYQASHTFVTAANFPSPVGTIAYSKSLLNPAHVTAVDNQGRFYNFQGSGSVQTSYSFPFTGNTQPLSHYSGFTFTSAYSNGGVIRAYYHDYDMATERVLLAPHPNLECHYEVII